MAALNVLRIFQTHPEKAFFRPDELGLFLDLPKRRIGHVLERLVRAGIVERPLPGWYRNPFGRGSPEKLAMLLRPPSYLSLEYALSRTGILSQTVFLLTAVTTRGTYTCRSTTHLLEFHHLAPRFFHGFEWEDDVAVALPEKALLDFVHLDAARYGPGGRERLLSFLDDCYLDLLDFGRLADLARGFGPAGAGYRDLVLSAYDSLRSERSVWNKYRALGRETR